MASKQVKRTQKKAKGSLHRIPADWLPRSPLEPALIVADSLRMAFAGRATSANDIANVIGIAPHSRHFTDLISSALAYGIVNKEAPNVYSLWKSVVKSLLPPMKERPQREFGKRC